MLTRWRTSTDVPWALRAFGLLTVLAGLVVVVVAFAQFVVEGRGTPASVTPTEELVVGCLYRWVRNLMYIAVAARHPGRRPYGAGLPRR